ncbi:MAG: Ig-like domain repeat protein, partial [Methanobrevibacter sp.]|uniref:Ig-like domain-containing protein n=1 Tax=Methanobrevibacter sp. TaxID=66852 RepID=UPI0025E81E4E
MGQDNLLNAIYSTSDVSFTNVTYWGAEGVANTGSSAVTPSRSQNEAGQNITVTVVVNDVLILNTTKVTNADGKILLDAVAGNYNITARHNADLYYTQAQTTRIFTITGTQTSIDLSASGSTATAKITPEITGNITFTVENESGVVRTAEAIISDGAADLDLTGLAMGKYNITAVYGGNINYYPSKANITYEIKNIEYSVNVTSVTTNNKTVNITAKSNIPNDIIQGKLLFILPNSTEISANFNADGTWWAVYTFADYGDYKVNASYSGLDNVVINNATISICGSYTDLQALIDACGDGDVLVLPYSFRYIPSVDGDRFPSGVIVNKSLTIDGNSFSISGENSYRIFNITADVTLVNVSLVNGNASVGGALYVCDNVTLNIVNASFMDNKANAYVLSDAIAHYLKFGDVVVYHDEAIALAYIVGENYISAIYAEDGADIVFSNVTYWNGSSMVNSDVQIPVNSFYAAGENLTLSLYNGDDFVVNLTAVTVYIEEFGGYFALFNISDYGPDVWDNGKVYHLENDYYPYSVSDAYWSDIQDPDDEYVDLHLAIGRVYGLNTTVFVEYRVVNASVVVIIDGVEYPVDGNVSFNITPCAGNHTIKARTVYDNGIFVDGYELVFEVLKSEPEMGIVVVDCDGRDVVDNTTDAGVLITVNVTVKDYNVTGTVNVTVNGVVYPDVVIGADGIASLNITPEVAGDYVVNATYNGDSNHNITNTSNVRFTLKNSTYDIAVVVVPGVDGANTTVTVTVPGDVDGTVVVTVDGEDYPVTVDENGTGSVDIP